MSQGRHVNWRAIVGLIVSGVSLYIVIQNLRPAEVWQAFRQAHYLWIVPAVALYLFALVIVRDDDSILLFFQLLYLLNYVVFVAHGCIFYTFL